METLWFVLVALALSLYAILAGMGLGAGLLHPIVGRTDRARDDWIRSIRSPARGDEIWLLAAAAALYLAFPAVLAAGGRGLPRAAGLLVALWGIRWVAAAARPRISRPASRRLGDAVLSLASLALVLLFGLALGIVVRGVPIDAGGRFRLPLWSGPWPGSEPAWIDPYTISVALSTVAALALHGALRTVRKTTGALQARARRAADLAWWAAAAATVLLTLLTMRVQPQIAQSLHERPWGYAFPFTSLAGLVLVLWFSSREQDGPASFASGVYLAGMIASAAFGIYPFLVPATTDPSRGLTVFSAAAPAGDLRIGLAWWIPGTLVAGACMILLRRRDEDR